ncbi:MAG TPA: ATP-grasp domain-containing protein [Edaphobacter sp.]|nr:ATP-grasp domain-containing protein [Edaphobacter sp.]
MPTNILISSAGRRVGLLEAFRDSLSALGLTGRLIAVDATDQAAAGEIADAFYLVPRCDDPLFIPKIKEICEAEHVGLIVPTIDTELRPYAAAREAFRREGTAVGISDPRTIAICEDKMLTHQWLVENGFPAPRQSVPGDVARNPSEWNFPVVIKPRNGSASSGFKVIKSVDDLHSVSCDNSMILQEFIQGKEFTVNVFINRHGQCLCAVPHYRIEVRAGEVSKGVTTRDTVMMELVRNLVEALPGAYGAMNVQCFLTPRDEIRIIEINARFGGGYPLAHQAGATISRWLLEESLGLDPRGPFDTWQDGVVMLRYDQAVFLRQGKSRARTIDHAPSVHSF